MKYVKPEVIQTAAVAAVVHSAEDAKPGIQNDGVQATGSAYEADE